MLNSLYGHANARRLKNCTVCDRCHRPLKVWSLSFFNTDVCCELCLEDERLAPTYEYAKRIESEEVAHGNYNFTGVGLTPADAMFLAQRRRDRC